MSEDDDSSDDDYDRKKKKKAIKKKSRCVSSESEGMDDKGERKRKKKTRVKKVVEESGSEDEYRVKKRKSKKARKDLEEDSSEEDSKKKKKAARRDDEPDGEKEAKREVQTKIVDVDINGIVRRIQGLKVDNSEYAVCYFKLLEARLTVAQLLPSPFQHMRSVIVQQAATYPNSIPISGQHARSPNCHFCGKPGCRIDTCNTVNDYVKAGCVIRKGRMVLYSDKGSITWNSQGLKILVDIRFGGPLPIPTVISALETTRIQTMFISCLPKTEQVVSAIIQEEDGDDVPVRFRGIRTIQ